MSPADEFVLSAAARRWLEDLPEPRDVAPVARSTDEIHLPEEARIGIGLFVDGLATITLPPVSRLILYGSYARGDFNEESDVDLAIVLAGEASKDNDARSNEAFDVIKAINRIDYEDIDDAPFIVSMLVLWESDLLRPEIRKNPPFYRNVLKDGVRITPAL